MSDLLSGAAPCHAPVPSLAAHRKEPSSGNLASYLRTVLQAYVIASSQGRSASQPPSRPHSPSASRPADQPQASTPSNPLAKWNWQKSCRKAARLSKEPNPDAPGPGSSALLLKCEHWLEATDPKHRYGSHLRPYYTHWLNEQPEDLDAPPCSEDFFEWLDEGPGRLVDLSCEGVSRSTLEASRVRYLSYEERGQYEVEVDEYGMLRYKSSGHVVHTHDEATADDMNGACPSWAPASAPTRIRFAAPCSACQPQPPRTDSPIFRRACRRAASAPGDDIPPSDDICSDSDPELLLASDLTDTDLDAHHAERSPSADGTHTQPHQLPDSPCTCRSGIAPSQLQPHPPHPAHQSLPHLRLPICVSDPFPALTSTPALRTPPGCHQTPFLGTTPAAAAITPSPIPTLQAPALHPDHTGCGNPCSGAPTTAPPRTPPHRPQQPRPAAPTTPSQAAAAARDRQLATALLARPHVPHQGAANGKKEKCGWIYVMDITHRIYIHRKQRGLFHHSSFVCGAAVLAAGGLEVRHGVIEKLSAHSGHYRPDEGTFLAFVEFLKEQGADLRFTRILGVSGKKGAPADGQAAQPQGVGQGQGRGQGAGQHGQGGGQGVGQQGQGPPQHRRLPAAMRRDGEMRALLMRRNSF